MKQLLFFDIDGTLAVPGQHPSAETAQAIRAARANGHKVFLCTGRTEQNVPDAIRDIGFDGGIYSAGGRVVIGGKTISDHAMTQDMAQMIIAVLQKVELPFTLECANENYKGGPDPLLSIPLDVSSGNSELRRILLASNKKLIAQYRNEPVYKVSFLATSQKQIDLMAKLLDHSVKVVVFSNLRPNFPLIAGEVSDKNIHKGQALQCVCEYFGTTAKWSIAFGDSMNDVEMLQTAGIGIAMGNSEEQVKTLADWVCESCADNGVAKTLDRFGIADFMK